MPNVRALLHSLLTALFLCFVALPAAFAQEGPKLYLDTPIPVRITQAVTSETDTSVIVISQIQAVVERDIVASDGTVMIRANTPVEVRAARQRSRGRGRPGSIELTALSTTSTDNQLIQLTGGHRQQGRSYKGRVWLLAGGMFAAAVVTGALLINAGQKDEATQVDDGGGKRLAGGIILGLSPAAFLWLLRYGQPAEVPEGFVMPHVKPALGYTIRTQ